MQDALGCVCVGTLTPLCAKPPVLTQMAVAKGPRAHLPHRARPAVGAEGLSAYSELIRGVPSMPSVWFRESRDGLLVTGWFQPRTPHGGL